MKSKLLLCALLAITFPVLADTSDTLTYGADDAPAKGQLKRPGPLPEPLGRIFPDLPMEFKDHITLKEAAFSLTPGLVLLADYTHFSQDAESVEQVGIQDSAWESRAVGLSLITGSDHLIDLESAYDSPDPRLALYDLAQDPGETRNLAPSEPARVQAMVERLAAIRRGGH